MVFITLQDNRKDNQKITSALNKGKRDHLRIEDLGSSRNPKSTKNKGKIPWI